jgi:hypothetical protein
VKGLSRYRQRTVMFHAAAVVATFQRISGYNKAAEAFIIVQTINNKRRNKATSTQAIDLVIKKIRSCHNLIKFIVTT